VKPDLTFFGEVLPSGFWERLRADFESADGLLVMGTSLQVGSEAAKVSSGLKGLTDEAFGLFVSHRFNHSPRSSTGYPLTRLGS